MLARDISAIACVSFVCACGQPQERHAPPSGTDSTTSVVTHTDLRAIVRSAPKLPLEAVELKPQPPR